MIRIPLGAKETKNASFFGQAALNSVDADLGPVVQSIVSLTSSLVVKMKTLLVSTISNSQVFFQQKY